MAEVTSKRTRETREQKLRRLGSIRVNRALVAIQRCERLANYGTSQDQEQSIIAALEAGVDQLRTRFEAFHAKGGRQANKFEL